MMSKKTKIILSELVFLITAMVDVYAVITENKVLEIIFKPLLMTTLVFVYLAGVEKADFWFVSGLFFSFLGDVFLLDKASYFTFGIASFLVTHLIYIKITVGFLEKYTKENIFMSAIPFILLFIGVLYLTFENLGFLLVHVMIYGITIATFGAITLLNYRQKRTSENLLLLLGAILFILSDSLIAVNNFYSSQQAFNILIILLYLFAQFLICNVMIVKSRLLLN